MNVRVYSDFVCPFCFLEIPALEKLAQEEGAELDYRAFELRPEPVPTLEPRGQYLVTTWDRAVYPMAECMGIPIRLPPVQPRSRLAFEGAEFARDHGRLPQYTRAVHEAFFQHGNDIGRPEVLAALAAQVGLDPDAFTQSLSDHRHLPRVLEQEAEAARIGVNAVPTTVIGDYVLRGCVPYDTLREAVRLARQQPHTTP